MKTDIIQESRALGHERDRLLDQLQTAEKAGNVALAESLQRRYVEAARRCIAFQNLHMYDSSSALARSTGDYSFLEHYLKQTLKDLRETYGENHRLVGIHRINMARTYHETKDRVEAGEQFEQGITILRQASPSGKEDLELEKALLHHAALLTEIGQPHLAEQQITEALEILGNIRIKSFPNVPNDILLEEGAAAGLLARSYSQMNDRGYADIFKEEIRRKRNMAIPLYKHASLGVFRALKSQNDPRYTIILNDYASYLLENGHYAEAEEQFRELLQLEGVLKIRNSPEINPFLFNLAICCMAMNRFDESFSLMAEVAALDDLLIKNFAVYSQSRQMNLKAGFDDHLQPLLTLICQHFADSPEHIAAAHRLMLHRKAIVQEAVAFQTIGGEGCSDVTRKLATVRAEIGRELLVGSLTEGEQQRIDRLSKLHRQEEELEIERMMFSRSPDSLSFLNVEPKSVSACLPEGSTVVEWVCFSELKIEAKLDRGESPWIGDRYLAFIMHAGSTETVMIDLGEAQTIDDMITTFRTSITGRADKRDAASLAPGEAHLSQLTMESRGKALRAVIFDPLLPALRGCKRIFIAPDCGLTKLPFEVLPNDNGGCLVDHYHFVYVTVGRDILRFGSIGDLPSSPPVVVADPDYDLPIAGSHATLEAAAPFQFSRLEGTRIEGEKVAKLLKIKPLMGAEATEQAIKNTRSPIILHLATHGFFLSDEKRYDPTTGQLLPDTSSAPGGHIGKLSGHWSVSTENRCGLALAGANRWLRGEELPEQAEEGLLMGYDIPGIDLKGTELVVLSACDTALGDIQAGEGVLGLGRSFLLAGAKTLVTSLWKVPDKETQELMVDFYQRILKGEPRAEALRQAQLAMKTKHGNPYYWGAFICQGDPGPLSKSSLW